MSHLACVLVQPSSLLCACLCWVRLAVLGLGTLPPSFPPGWSETNVQQHMKPVLAALEAKSKQSRMDAFFGPHNERFAKVALAPLTPLTQDEQPLQPLTPPHPLHTRTHCCAQIQSKRVREAVRDFRQGEASDGDEDEGGQRCGGGDEEPEVPPRRRKKRKKGAAKKKSPAKGKEASSAAGSGGGRATGGDNGSENLERMLIE